MLEGLAFVCRDVVDRLAARSLATDRLRLLGGGSQSADADTCAVGAAMFAAVAAGLHRDLVGQRPTCRAPGRRTSRPATAMPSRRPTGATVDS